MAFRGSSSSPNTSRFSEDRRDFPPLLPVGFHRADLRRVQSLCVDYFPNSASRPLLMVTLREIVGLINRSSIPAALWIDGPFLTEAPDPEVFDITMVLVESVLSGLSREQTDFFDWFRTNSLFDKYRANNYGIVIDGSRPDGDLLYRYWLRQYGFDREENKKGVIELIVPSLAQ
jgi:hypothetical protein